MTDIDRLKQKLSKYEFCYDNEFHFFQQTDYHQDFEMYITDTQNKKLRILVKGVVQSGKTARLSKKLAIFSIFVFNMF